MSDSTARKLDQVDTTTTVRINRRASVLKQIEAALLANELSVLELHDEATGTDPYNSTRAAGRDPWSPRTR